MCILNYAAEEGLAWIVGTAIASFHGTKRRIVYSANFTINFIFFGCIAICAGMEFHKISPQSFTMATASASGSARIDTPYALIMK